MPNEDLRRRIRLGEDSTLEFKSVDMAGKRVRAPHKAAVADELAALANSRGGTVLLGVDDQTHQVEGIPRGQLDAAETWLRDICNDAIKPALDAAILKMELENAAGELVPLLRVDVPRSLFVHESPGGYFQRIGSSKRKMPPDVLARALQQRSRTRLVSFDESIVPHATRDDLHYDLTQRFLGDAVDETDVPLDETLRKLGILGRPDGQFDQRAGVTLAGVLLCTREPQRWLRHAVIQAVSYVGERHDSDYQSDARDIGGPLDGQVADALHFVRRNMMVRAQKQLARMDRPQFSERAVFEALANAVAHRDYSMAGSRVRLHLFADRLELYVPGALTNTMTPDSLHLRQSNRNDLIVSLLARCAAPGGVGRTRLMDVRGDGVPIIRRECKALAGRLPEYTMIDDAELRLVMWAAR